MSVVPTLPPTLDFSKKKAAARASIQRATLPPMNANSFAPRSQCVFRIPTGTVGSYLDLSGSYLKFTLTNTANQSANLDGLATSCIQRIEASVAGGSPLFVIEEVGALMSVLIDNTVSRGDRVTKWGIAGSTDSNNGRTGLSLAATSGSTVLCTPLPGPLGMHGEGRMIPLGAIASPLELRITWADSSIPLKYGTAPTTASFTITNVTYEACIVNMDSQVNRVLDESLSGIYNMPCSSFLQSSTIVQGNDTSFNMQINGSVASAQMVIIAIRDNNIISDTTKASVTGRITGSLTGVQLRIGTLTIPSVPITIGSSQTVEARAELLKAFSCLTRGDVGSCVTQTIFDTNSALGEGGFAMAFNLDAFRCTDSLLDGVSTELQTMQLIGTRTATSAYAIRIDAWVMYDVLLRVQDGVMNKFENSNGIY